MKFSKTFDKIKMVTWTVVPQTNVLQITFMRFLICFNLNKSHRTLLDLLYNVLRLLRKQIQVMGHKCYKNSM